MNSRVAATGRTRICPHCKATILESASICPGCNHHLRFDSKAIREKRAQPAVTAFRIDGSFRNIEGTESCEYSIVISIRNQRGDEIDRKVIGVGALGPNDSRTITLSVDMFGARRP